MVGFLLPIVEKGHSMPTKKPARQQATVPFLWEEKPGVPKNDWKLETVSVKAVRPPGKLVTTIPFQWEEKPGTPLPGFSYPERSGTSVPSFSDWKEKPGTPVPSFSYLQRDSPLLPLPPAKLIYFPPSGYPPCSPPVKIREKLGSIFYKIKNYSADDFSEADNEEENDSALDEEQEDREPEEAAEDYEEEDDANDVKRERQEEMFELDMEATETDKDEHVSSGMSLLANCCIPTEAISNAIPMEQYETEEEESCSEYESLTSSASEAESCFSSSATGSSSLMGSFMQCFFPQFSPESGYPDEVHYHDESYSPTLPDPHESNLTPRTPTLGELVRVSGRGYRKRNPSLNFMMKGFRCFSGTGSRASAAQ